MILMLGIAMALGLWDGVELFRERRWKEVIVLGLIDLLVLAAGTLVLKGRVFDLYPLLGI